MTADPGPLWPDDVVHGAISEVVIRGHFPLSSDLAAAVRAALNAPEVTAHLRRQADGWREAFAIGIEKQAENARLAAALADATGKIADIESLIGSAAALSGPDSTLNPGGAWPWSEGFVTIPALRAALAGDGEPGDQAPVSAGPEFSPAAQSGEPEPGEETT